MSIAEQLRAAKALIDTPDKWTQGSFARDNKGVPVGGFTKGRWDVAAYPESPAPACYCAEGAIRLVRGGVLPHALEEIMERAVPRTFYAGANCRKFVLFNDHRDTSHADVMKMFDRAIKLAEKVQ